MFCKNCGNEIQNNAKFCTKCGYQVGDTEGTSKNGRGGAAIEKSDYKKIIMIAVIIVCIILIAILVMNKALSGKRNQNNDDQNNDDQNNTMSLSAEKKGFDSIETAIDALFNAAYEKNLDAVSDCFPKELESYVRDLYNQYRSADGGTLRANFFRFMDLNPDNDYWYVIDPDSIAELEYFEDYQIRPGHYITEDQLLDEYGLAVDVLYGVVVDSMVRYSDGTGFITTGSKAFLEVAKIGDAYFIIAPDDAFLNE